MLEITAIIKEGTKKVQATMVKHIITTYIRTYLHTAVPIHKTTLKFRQNINDNFEVLLIKNIDQHCAPGFNYGD